MSTKAQLRFDMQSAFEAGQKGHPQTVMSHLADGLGFTILSSVPQSIADQWWFWVEWQGDKPQLPSFLSEMAWTPEGTP